MTENVMGLIFVNDQVIRIRKGSFVSISATSDLVTPREGYYLISTGRIKPRYRSRVKIHLANGRKITFDASRIDLTSSRPGSRFRADLVCGDRNSGIWRVVLWEGRIKRHFAETA